MLMNDYLKREFSNGFGQLLAVQTEFVKQVAEVNKKMTVEVLKNTKAALDAYTRSIDSEIRRLEN